MCESKAKFFGFTRSKMVRSVKVTMLFVIVLPSFVSASALNYCSIESCGLRPHTLCLFPTSGPSARCGKNIISSGLTKEEKQRIVDLHNELRQRVAAGKETRGNPGPQPPAKYMPKVEWDDELADLAQRWADQCNFAHDNCRDVERFKVGQNIASLATTGNVHDLKIEEMIQMWYDEVKDFSKNDVSQFSSKAIKAGHYTQLIWAKSIKIGCGAVKYVDGGFNKFFLVCNYGPAGNIIGQPIYETR